MASLIHYCTLLIHIFLAIVDQKNLKLTLFTLLRENDVTMNSILITGLIKTIFETHTLYIIKKKKMNL